jgi:hypothetical protein
MLPFQLQTRKIKSSGYIINIKTLESNWTYYWKRAKRLSPNTELSVVGVSRIEVTSASFVCSFFVGITVDIWVALRVLLFNGTAEITLILSFVMSYCIDEIFELILELIKSDANITLKNKYTPTLSRSLRTYWHYIPQYNRNYHMCAVSFWSCLVWIIRKCVLGLESIFTGWYTRETCLFFRF